MPSEAMTPLPYQTSDQFDWQRVYAMLAAGQEPPQGWAHLMSAAVRYIARLEAKNGPIRYG